MASPDFILLSHFASLKASRGGLHIYFGVCFSACTCLNVCEGFHGPRQDCYQNGACVKRLKWTGIILFAMWWLATGVLHSTFHNRSIFFKVNNVWSFIKVRYKCWLRVELKKTTGMGKVLLLGFLIFSAWIWRNKPKCCLSYTYDTRTAPIPINLMLISV